MASGQVTFMFFLCICVLNTLHIFKKIVLNTHSMAECLTCSLNMWWMRMYWMYEWRGYNRRVRLKDKGDPYFPHGVLLHVWWGEWVNCTVCKYVSPWVTPAKPCSPMALGSSCQAKVNPKQRWPSPTVCQKHPKAFLTACDVVLTFVSQDHIIDGKCVLKTLMAFKNVYKHCNSDTYLF